MRRKVIRVSEETKYYAQENNDSEMEREESGQDWKKKCEWKLENIDQEKKNYIIWNQYYQEVTYSVKRIF